MSGPVKPDAPRAASRARQSSPDESDGSTIRVVAMRTGLGMETLRAWERRYGFPRPERRAGSNRRLYSEKDIERLLVIRRALDRGYRVGDVITKSLAELEELAELADPADTRSSAPPVSSAANDSRAGVSELIALLARDAIGELELELRRGAAALGPRRFVTDVAHPFAVSVGEEWANGRLEVRHEHMATECLITQLRQMLATFQDIEARPLVLLATLPGEPHTLALQMVALFLVSLGAKPRLLGASTPPADLVESARILDADVVGLTVTPSSDLRQAKKDVLALRRKLPPHVPLWIGGGGAPALGVEGDTTSILTSWDAIAQAVTERRRPVLPTRSLRR